VPAQTLETDAFVLTKRLPADSFQSFTVFSTVHGSLLVLQRISKTRAGSTGKAKPGNASVALDLFDHVSLFLESSNQGRTWFVKEARLIQRHAGIGRSYEALREASALATLIARNPVHEDSRAAVTQLLTSAFTAFAGPRPDIVYFKSLYRFARDEGYPMKEHWFATLSASERAEAATLLNRPLAEQSASVAAVARLQRRMDDYLRGHTEILLD
jgi:hypothetical protein